MSYDLVFWKQRPECRHSPAKIYESLAEGNPVEGLETISVSEVITRIKQHFPGTFPNGDALLWDDDERGAFELESSDQHIVFCCRQLIVDDINSIIDILHEFDCPLYDPQENVRFVPPV